MSAVPAIEDVVARIVERLSPERVILFGSHARGDAEPGSDVDIFIEMDVSQLEGRRSVAVRRAIGACDFPLDIVVFTPDEVRYWSQAAASLPSTALREGQILYERG